MAIVSNLVVDLIGAAVSARDASTIGLAFFDALRPFGATAINARGYQSTNNLAEAGQVFARLAPDSFMPVYNEHRFYADNPLPFAARTRSMPFLWSDLVWSNPKAKWVRDTMHDCGCPDGIFVPCHGPNHYLGAVSIAFERLAALNQNDQRSIELASYFIHERMKAASIVEKAVQPRLSCRERDCLSFVAEGKTDIEIADILHISAPTVAFHLSNARRKLGARTRAQAVARFVMSGF